MLDSWSVYLTLYRMTACWTRNQCIWHYTEWRHVGLVISVSDIIQNGSMLDLWSVYLTLYRMDPCWTRDLCIWHYTEWCWTCDLCIWHYTGCWTCDLCIWHYTEWCWTCDLCIWHYTEWCWTCDLCIWYYTEWRNVGLVICVSDIIQNESVCLTWMMLDSWSVYQTSYRMTACWTRELCISHYTEWRHVGLVICVSDIIQNDGMLD